MKKLFFIPFLLFAGLLIQAQTDNWKIKLHGKLLLSASKENEKANCKKVKSSLWNKNGFLEINFNEAGPDTWWRSFLFYDEQDNEIIRKDSTTYYKVSVSELRKLFGGKKEIRLYTTVSPKDPNLAVRIRRVHLCTLRLP